MPSIDGRGFLGGPPGGDYENYQYTPGIGWFYVGNAEEGTAGKSSYLNREGRRVHYTPQRRFDWSEVSERRDRDLRRETADKGWLVGGEIVFDYQNTDPNWRPGRSVGNGTGNPTSGGMMSLQNPSKMSMSVEDFNDAYGAVDYTKGWDSIKREGYYELRDIHGGRAQNPFANYMSNDMEGLRDLYRTDTYNPLYGTQTGRAYENRRENNALDYLYNAFSGRDQITNRREMNKRLNQYAADRGVDRSALMGTRMTEGMFNEMGLQDFGLEYDAEFNPGFQMENPLKDFDSSVGKADSGNFVESYNAEKERLNNRKSVMSLFEEMKNFDE